MRTMRPSGLSKTNCRRQIPTSRVPEEYPVPATNKRRVPKPEKAPRLPAAENQNPAKNQIKEAFFCHVVS